MEKLNKKFYLGEDVIALSRSLLGKWLFTRSTEGVITGGRIIETEAYKGAEDRACHAYNNKKTKRNEMMFEEGGIIYVYLCYGIHPLLNIVTNNSGIPHAILIRSIEPLVGVDKMLERRGKTTLSPSLTQGPGTVTQALGIDLTWNGKSLTDSCIWIENRSEQKPQEIELGPRVGVEYAGPDALLPWRFWIKGALVKNKKRIR